MLFTTTSRNTSLALAPFGVALAMGLLFGWQSVSHSETAGSGDSPDVVELFTSHGCSSCPSADKLLGELIEKNPDLVALEFHVDYWDQLVHGGSNWVDPYSDPAYTDRQRMYNLSKLGGRPGVYTPQLIINGEYAAVGSDRRRITAQLGQNTSRISVSAVTESGQLSISLDNPEKLSSQIWLARFEVSTTTHIKGGENRDLKLTNHHVVKSLESIQKIDSELVSLNIPLQLAAGESCAILVQSEPLQPILGATLCPM